MEQYLLNERLVEASENGDINMVKRLIQIGATSYDIALKEASLFGHLEIVKYLIEKGANIQANNNLALRMAVMNKHLDIVKYLIENGADIHINNEYILRKATELNHLEMIKYLIENGANWYLIKNRPIFKEILKQETNNLKNILTTNYITLNQYNPEIDIGSNIKYKIPKSLLLKTVYEVPYQQYCSAINGKVPPIQLIALANILQQNTKDKNKLDYNIDISWFELCDKIKHALYLLL